MNKLTVLAHIVDCSFYLLFSGRARTATFNDAISTISFWIIETCCTCLYRLCIVSMIC